VPSGVILGSVIGPLPFVIFINDLPEVIRFSRAFLYADDLKLCSAIKTVSDRLNMQIDIGAVADWANAWLLPLCSDKLYTFARW
jgi:hypothetical protein